MERFELDESFESFAPPPPPDGPDLVESANDRDASPVIQLADRILVQALSRQASDIHIEPQEDGLHVRLRLDGVLQNAFETLPAKVIPALTSRFKIMADLDIAERRQPQDGRIRRRYQGNTVDFRVSVLPSRFGEKIVLRLLDSSATELGLDLLITDSQALAEVRDMGSKPYGILLVTGPTGSGKSTTLYSLLAERNDPGAQHLHGGRPDRIHPGWDHANPGQPRKGVDFAKALRAFMRQDPDVLLVGETRDLETAKTALEAALTGHLVLTTLHCNDAPSAVARLEEMGVETYLLSASLIGVLSQRLLRKLCTHCRQPYQPKRSHPGPLRFEASQNSSISFYQPPANNTCSHCHGLGYKGRIGVYEVMRVNEVMAEAIGQGAGTDQLRHLALSNGMKTLLGYGLELARQGHTSLEEVERVLLTDSGLEQEIRARNLSTATCEGCGAGLRDEWLDCPYCLTPRGTLQE